MTYLASGVARLATLALAVASLSSSGCSLVGGSCNCPQLGGATVVLPAAQSSPIANITTGTACSASDYGGGQIGVTARSNTPTTCGVTVELMNGDTYAFSVEFRAFDPGGCCSGVQGFALGQPTQIDGGVDGRDANAGG